MMRMNHFTTLIQALRADPWRIFPFAAIAGAGLLTLKLTLPPASHERAVLYLLQAAALFMLFLSSAGATRLARTAHILAQRHVPAALWTDSVTQRLAGVWTNGIALLAALAVTWGLGGATPAQVLASIATLSLTACAGTLFSTLRSGLLPGPGQRTVHVLALAALVACLTYGHTALSALVHAPTAAWLVGAASWPLMAFALQRYWRVMPRVVPPVQTSTMQAWVSNMLRYAFLHPRFLQDNKLQFGLVSNMRMGTASLCWSLMPPIELGGSLTVGHLLAFIPWIPAAMTTMTIRDLHWRTMLAPARVGTPSLAWRIYRTSLTLAFFLLLILMLGHALLDTIWGGSKAGILINMEKWAVFGMQAPLLVAVNVLLCALPNPRRTMWGGFIVAFLALAVMHVGGLYSVPIAGLRAGPAYMAGIAALSGLVMLVANRRWTQSALLPYLPQRPVSMTAFSAAR
ncbi:MAG: hypothetical protein K2X55_02585 [Burkholderiaceae bacterium]|nr:hypothetical protein [Burkholderiaceae bacterium]